MTGNLAASVRARLSNQAKAAHRPFQEILQYYGLERFLYRLSRSPHSDRFLLKGALMLRVWGTPGTRPTRDIDLLGYIPNEIELLSTTVKEICGVQVEDDGLLFDASAVVGERIKEGAEYEGVRIKFTAFLENARVPIQLDIGFGDTVYPEPQEKDYPTILDLPAPRLRVYPLETVVAEKFEAMIKLGTLNSRMKDFFDIWLLATQFDFAGAELAGAISRTFQNRGTDLETEPVALTSEFTSRDTTRKQWTAFVRRSILLEAPASLEDIREPLRRFLLPVAAALVEDRGFAARWIAPGPWTTSTSES